MNAKLKVVSPLGEPVSDKITPLAPRLDTLNGKTVGEIWTGGFKADVMFPIIRGMLRERFPQIRIVPFTELPTVSIFSLEAHRKAATLDSVRHALKAKGVDALITGNGG